MTPYLPADLQLISSRCMKKEGLGTFTCIHTGKNVTSDCRHCANKLHQ